VTRQTRRRTRPTASPELADRSGRDLFVRPFRHDRLISTLSTVWNAPRSLWAEPAVKNPPQRGRRDWLLAALLASGVVLEALFRRNLVWRPVAIGFGFALVVAVLVRRSRPLPAVAVAFGTLAALDVATFVANSDPVALYSATVVVVLAYSVFRWGSGRHATVGLGFMAISFIASVATDSPGAGDTIGGAAVLLLAAVLGLSIRYRGTAREQLVEQAKLHEREQLARELHDTVAHHVSAIAIQAQAGLFLARSSSLSGATEALEVIEREAAHTLAEMRTMVSALRDRHTQPRAGPPRNIADVERLATDNVGAVRVDVELCGDLGGLTPALEAAIYRVAQESVTNAKRHAHQPTRVEVRETGSATDVRLTVSDDGARTSADPNTAGYGLVGMTERVTLLGGTFTAGPGPDRGWAVQAVLPRRARTA
jgi:signal transduction histidine kinase